MEGQLHEHPLAELISEISEKGFSGALRSERERVKAVIYFEAGELVYAAANLRVLRLSEVMRQQGIELKPAHQSLSDAALITALLGEGLVQRQRLNEILTAQIGNVARV